MEKADPRRNVGLYLGIERSSEEYRVGTTAGSVVKAVTMKRLSQTHHWQPELVKGIRGYPWCPAGPNSDLDKAKVAVDGEDPDTADMPEGYEYNIEWPEEDCTDVQFDSRVNVATRKFPLRASDCAKYGHTKGCRCCVSLQKG